MEAREADSVNAEETHLLNTNQVMDESIQPMREFLTEEQQLYATKLSSLHERVNALNKEMDQVLRSISEIDLIRREQAEIEKQCELLESMQGVTPEIWQLCSRLDSLETSAKGVVGEGTIEKEGLSASVRSSRASDSFVSGEKTSSPKRAPKKSPPPPPFPHCSDA